MQEIIEQAVKEAPCDQDQENGDGPFLAAGDFEIKDHSYRNRERKAEKPYG